MKGNLRPIVFVLTVVLIVACGFSNGYSSGVEGGAKTPLLGEANRKKIEAVLDKYIAESKSPAGIVGVWTPDGECVVAKGKSDVKAGTDAKTTDRFRIASVTKTFTATLLLMLVDEKKIGLDDKLSKFYPDVKNAEKITIRQLLDHTSGIFSYNTVDEFNKYIETDPFKKWSTDEIFKIIAANKPYFEPGKGFNYSNSNYMLAGMLVEKISGNKYADELKKKICEPLGMKDTYYAVTPEIEGPHFHGYEDTKDVSVFDPSGPNFAGGIVSTISDLKIWAEALAEGKLLSKQLQAERLKFVVRESNQQMGYGLGIMSQGAYLGHNGSVTGYCIVMSRHPGRAVTIISMLPMSPQCLKGATESVFNDVAELLLPGEHLKNVKAEITVK